MIVCVLPSPEIVELCRMSNDTTCCIFEKCEMWKQCKLPETKELTYVPFQFETDGTQTIYGE